MNNLKYCKALKQTLIDRLEKRFDFIFDLKMSGSKPYILAAMSHPKFKSNWIPPSEGLYCKNLFITECELAIHNQVVENTNNSDNDRDSEEDYYSGLQAPTLTETNDNSNLEAIRFLNGKKKRIRVAKLLSSYKKYISEI